MQNVIQNTGEKGDGILELHAWYGKQANTFVYYEDDGSSYNYQQGEYYKREITFDPAKATITLAPVEGTFQSRFTHIKLVLHGFKGNKKTVQVNQKTVKLSPDSGNAYALFDNNSQEIIVQY